MQRECIEAVELFSGIGGWSFALEKLGLLDKGVHVAAAYDSNQQANKVYSATFGLSPVATDIATLPPEKLRRFPLWLMSPPCQPYTSGSKRLDDEDTRASALSHLVSLIHSGAAVPELLAVENVPLFRESHSRMQLVAALEKQGFVFQEFVVSPETLCGLPSRRLRYYLVASRTPVAAFPKELVPELPEAPVTLARFFGANLSEASDALRFPQKWREKKNGFRFHVVGLNDANAVTQCATKHYYETYNSGGSYLSPSLAASSSLEAENLAEDLRFFSPRELCLLFGFPASFHIDETVGLKSAFRLIGNSLNVAVTARILSLLFATNK
jgi:site-specific DNA-cytosine methylase